VVSAALAGMMSTADSQLLVISSSMVQDVFIKILKLRPSEQGAVRLSRAVVLAVVAGALAASLTKASVYLKVLDAWFGLGAGLGPAVVFGLWAPWARRRGIIAGMFAGLGTAFTWDAWPLVRTMEHRPPTILPAVVLASLAIVLFSLTGPNDVEGSEAEADG